MKSIEELFEREFKGVENIEPLLCKLRELGLSQIQTVALLKKKTGLPLKQLDAMVLNSITWKDTKEANISFRNSFFDKLDEPQKGNSTFLMLSAVVGRLTNTVWKMSNCKKK